MPAYRSKSVIQGSFFVAAVVVGFVAVLFEETISDATRAFDRLFHQDPLLFTLATPLLFLVATGLVVLLAPAARGSGIPQTLRALMMSMASHSVAVRSGLISLRTAAVKILSATVGILAGASIGREGPTIQISTAVFAWIGNRVKRIYPHVEFHSYLVAGAAAGVAAAFNTPLAGITFALEEMAEGAFAQIKQTVMVSVIIAGITAQTLVGNYLYFGSPRVDLPEVGVVMPALVIGVAGGVFGCIFAKLLIWPIFNRLRTRWWQKALICGAAVGLMNYLTSAQTAGTGYEITRNFMESDAGQFPLLYFPLKILATVFSFQSGMAAGFFAPSLAIGAGMGATVGQLAQFATDLKICGLLGMVAFFTGAVQAPLTAVIIVMEMTDIHELIIPLMLTAFVSQGIAKLIMPTPIYRLLARQTEEPT